jgi:RNA 3'-terminal phosphate cyclase (ATP)/RNA 3'-terminal phosphate cyclase (GTP)
MIELDGAEAGGQFVRTAVALSALTGKAVKIINIRGARPDPGLKTQHMEGIRSIAELCDAEIDGLSLGSRILEFRPKELVAKDLEVNISTAGSIGLVLQALLLPASQLDRPITIRIHGGGTWGKWAPPLPYLQHVLFPLIGDQTKIEIEKEGFYPKGGAEVKILVHPFKPKPIKITDKGILKDIKIISTATQDLQKARVAERQAAAATKLIKTKLQHEPTIETPYAQAMSTGSGIVVIAKTQNSVLGGDALGERGRLAEAIGEEAAKNLLGDYFVGAVDRHAGDMLLPYMALAGEGRIAVSQITQHIITNISVIEKFLNVKFDIIGEKGRPGTVSVNRI